TLLSIDLLGAEAVCAAPRGEFEVIHPISDNPMGEKREMLLESARISRGKISDIEALNPEKIDAAVIPGGRGIGINLCNLNVKGASCDMNPGFQKFLTEMHKMGKPLCGICLGTVILARSLHLMGITAGITTGGKGFFAKMVESMGHTHIECSPSSCVSDDKSRIVTTPAFMNASSLSETWLGIQKAVSALMEFAR
ncbi:MAG TPA: DJ-1/PfpI family protein, partial [bacterium]|nr:DJ-1/PfpI family protein [bacterium]